MSIGSLKGTKWALLAFTALAIVFMATFSRSATPTQAANPNAMAVDADTVTAGVQIAATKAVGAPFDVNFNITTAGTAWKGYNLDVDHIGLTFIPTDDYSDPLDGILESWHYTGLGGTTANAVVTPVGTRLLGGSATLGAASTTTGVAVVGRFSCDAPGVYTMHLTTSADASTPPFSTTLAAGGLTIGTDLADATITCLNMADWSSVKTDTGSDPVLAGGIVNYKIVATNNGPNASRGMSMFDELPNALDEETSNAVNKIIQGTVGAPARAYYPHPMLTIPGAVDVDLNGNGVLTDPGDIAAGTCMPGYLGTFLNPNWPNHPPTFHNFVICVVENPFLQGGGLGIGLVDSIPAGGIVTLRLSVKVPIADAGKNDFNVGGAATGSTFGEPNPTVDPLQTNEADCPTVPYPAGPPTVIPGPGVGHVYPASIGCEVTTTTAANVAVDKKVDVGAGYVDSAESVAGATVHYMITLTNGASASPATGVQVSDDLDTGNITYVASSLTKSANVGSCTTAVNGPIACTNIGAADIDNDPALPGAVDMAPGETAWIKYDATFAPTLVNQHVVNTAIDGWTDHGATLSDSVDVFVRSADAQMMKDPAMANLWLCDAAPPACTGPGQGSILISEIARNVANDPEDVDPMTGAVEPTDGLGAYEFNLEYDLSVLQIPVITDSGWLGSTGRSVSCAPSIIGENIIHWACISLAPPWALDLAGPLGMGPFTLATIAVKPQPNLYIDMCPGFENGVVTWLKDSACQWSDTLGDPMAGTLPGGDLKYCTSTKLTIRYLEGDLNHDCKVDLLDEQAQAWRYGSHLGSLWYTTCNDLQPYPPDNDIDVKDLQFVFGRAGSTCTNPYPAQPPMDP